MKMKFSVDMESWDVEVFERVRSKHQPRSRDEKLRARRAEVARRYGGGAK